MKQGGQRLAWVMKKALNLVEPGQALCQIDQQIEQLILQKEGRPSFKMVPGYRWASCLNVNQGVVHGVPNDYRLKEGDLLSLDIGFFYQGFHTDTSRTLLVGNSKKLDSKPKDKFLQAGKKALHEAIKATVPGKRVGHLSATIEREMKKAGFHPVEVLSGHGIGRQLHEEPPIPCFLKGKIEQTPWLKPGMTLAVEVIYTQGSPELVLKSDQWTLETADGQWAGLFEETLLVTKGPALVLTKIK